MIWIIIEEVTKEADIAVAGVLIAVLIYFAGMVRGQGVPPSEARAPRRAVIEQ